MATRFRFVSTLLAVAILAAGHAASDLRVETLLVLAVGLAWLIGQRRGWGWVASAALAASVGAAANGLQLWGGDIWAPVGLIAALSAWDLDHLTQRLMNASQVGERHDLERRHLWRLLVVDGLGLLLTEVALHIRVRLDFGLALLLGLLSIVGLSQAIRFLRRETG